MADGSYTAEQGDTADAGLLSVADLCQMFEDRKKRRRTLANCPSGTATTTTTSNPPTPRRRLLPVVASPRSSSTASSGRLTSLSASRSSSASTRVPHRAPQHEDDADGATQGPIYVADKENFDHKRSQVAQHPC